jgi:glycosyltransferase involved in cell wall biosynthesis
MYKAFENLGYDVLPVIGHGDERERAIQRIRKIGGQVSKRSFVYSESLSIPTLMTKRNFLFPRLDFAFFAWCREHGLPVGLFYRDIHWRFEQYTPSLRRSIAIPLYWYDWLNYRRTVDHLFLPSLAMREALPTEWPKSRISPLFPGCDRPDVAQAPQAHNGLPINPKDLTLFYVGGLTPPLYDLQSMFEVVGNLDNVSLIVCCREPEWARVQDYYRPLLTSKFHIVHAHGEDLATYYAQADVFGLFWEPTPYLDFAMPVKLFETLGYAVPIVTTAGTEVARFVAREDIGWVVKTPAELTALLTRLRDDRTAIAEKRARMLAIREQHTWQARAQMVAETMARYTG